MEWKQVWQNGEAFTDSVLIVPCGMETLSLLRNHLRIYHVLIVPCGMETEEKNECP